MAKAKLIDFRTRLPKLDNGELEEKLQAYMASKKVQDLLDAIECLRGCQILLPGTVNEKKQITAQVLRGSNGQNLVPVYTSSKQIPVKQGNQSRGFLSMPYVGANDLVLQMTANGQKLDGIVLNPFTTNVGFQNKLLEAIRDAEKTQKETGEETKVKLNLPNPQPQQAMPEIDNSKVEEIARAFKDATEEADRRKYLNDILNALYQAKVVVGLAQAPSGQDVPELIVNKETQEKRLAVYTQPRLTVKKDQTRKISIIPFTVAVEAVLKMKPEEVVGMTIITPDTAVNFARKLLENVDLVNKQRDTVTARQKFEMEVLPKLLETEGQEFVDALCEQKEQYVDEQFEKSYYNIRMYPYLTEEFKVTALGIDENTDVVRIDFPTRDCIPSCATHAYVVWNKEIKSGRYFAFIKNMNNAQVIMEVVGQEIREHGAAPEESVELRTILELAKTPTEE